MEYSESSGHVYKVRTLVDGVESSPDNVAVSKGMVTYLMGQISFLYRELERVEAQLTASRNADKGRLTKVASRYHYELGRKIGELRESKLSLASCGATISKYERNVQALNRKLNIIQANYTTAVHEKTALHERLLKLSRDVSGRGEANDCAVITADAADMDRSDAHVESNGTSAENVATMLRTIEILTDERASLRRHVDALTAAASGRKRDAATSTELSVRCSDVGSGTDGVVVQDKESQSELGASWDDLCSGSPLYFSVVATLTEKTKQCDEFHVQVDELKESLGRLATSFSAVQSKLGEESERRRQAEANAERLVEQIRMLQRVNSAQAATEGQLQKSVEALEAQKSSVYGEYQKLERIRHAWEAEVRRYEGDIEVLQANKNYAAEQTTLLAAENERWQTELQHSRETEAQLKLALTLKETENAELMQAYRQCAKENEALIEAQKCVQREFDDLQARVSSRDGTVQFLQEQVKELHDREQQLLVDAQTLEFANSQMHQRIVHCESRSEQLESECAQLRQTLQERNSLAEDLQRELAGCGKQIALKDNEITLLHQSRIAYDQIASELRASLSTEQIKCRALERSNAELLSRDILIETHNYHMQQPRNRDEQRIGDESRTDTMTSAISALEGELRKEKDRTETLQKQLGAVAEEMRVLSQSKERLQEIIMRQTEALSQLAAEN